MVFYELNFPVRCPVDVPSGKIDESPGREIAGRFHGKISGRVKKYMGPNQTVKWELKISREISRPN